MSVSAPTPCAACQAPIVWITTQKGKSMPCNTPRVSVMTVAGELVSGFVPHWATCPAAASFKGRRA